MDYEKALKVLVHFNAWRRDDHIPNMYEMPDPKDIGMAIDLAIAVISNIVGHNIHIEDLENEGYLHTHRFHIEDLY